MTSGMDQLLAQYEHGHISRREYLTRATALMALVVASPARAAAATGPTIGSIKRLNHVTIFVQDVQKSKEFYQRLFGMPLLTPQDPGVNLKAGDGFLGIYPAQGAMVGINHVCFGLEHFDAVAVLRKLSEAGLKANIRLRGDTKELYFRDPDNVLVQLQDVRYIGGVGTLGDRPPR